MQDSRIGDDEQRPSPQGQGSAAIRWDCGRRPPTRIGLSPWGHGGVAAAGRRRLCCSSLPYLDAGTPSSSRLGAGPWRSQRDHVGILSGAFKIRGWGERFRTSPPLAKRLAALCGSLALAATGLLPAVVWASEGGGVQWWFPEAVSSYGVQIDRLFTIILWITGSIFVLVEGTLGWFLIRYRHRDGQRATYTHGNTAVEIVWTVVPACIVIYLALVSQRVWAHIQGTPPPYQLELEVKAEQFVWNIRYAGPDGKLHTADDIETINQLHIPVGQVVLVRLTSKDVIHSFFLPQFRIKRDTVPGMTGRIWLQATKTGHFEIVCAELCGLGHYRMRGFLTIETPEAFQQWLEQTRRGESG